MKFTQAADRKDTDGTCLQGYITATYAALVKAFGEPDSDGDGYKIDAKWGLKFEDGTVATIYNWKNGKNYCGVSAPGVKRITEWNIGGRKELAVTRVKGALMESRNGRNSDKES